MLKVIITVILLLALEGIKMLISRTTQPSDYFYYNLVSCLQFFLLAGCILILVTRPLLKRRIKKNLLLWQSAGYVVLVALLELGCSYLLGHPKSIPASLFPVFKFYYDHFECKIIQYQPDHTRFDTALFYSLKSDARFTYRNHEFANKFVTNSKGLRDDEASMSEPGIICIGDSYTMGWGLDEQQTFPAYIEKQTGLRVLNAGMSSYGTARESKMLSTLDTSNAQYLIWQYCANDEDENKSYLQMGHKLNIHTKQSLDSAMELHGWTRRYFPGRHFFTMAKLSINYLMHRPPMQFTPVMPDSDSVQLRRARDFVEILAGSAINLSKTKVIVLELGPYPLQEKFIDHVKELVAARGLSSSVLFLDCYKLLTKDDFYMLDVHLTPEGMHKVGEALMKLIKDE